MANEAGGEEIGEGAHADPFLDAVGTFSVVDGRLIKTACGGPAVSPNDAAIDARDAGDVGASDSTEPGPQREARRPLGNWCCRLAPVS
jgi:hypothetical protein